MSKLFNVENSDSDSEGKLNVNTDYANNYDSWRQKEELHKLKARYGEDVELSVNSQEESSESSEDDEGEEIPEAFEKDFYKTLAYLKNKDPKIYDKNIEFFKESEENNLANGTHVKEKKEKSLFLRDYERKIIVERNGKFSDSEEETEEQNKSRGPTYVQEQQELKESFRKVLQNDEDNKDEDLLLKPKTKTKDEAQKEEKDYKEWLKGQINNINEEEERDLKPLRDFWTDPNLDKNEKFLRDYILNKKFLENQSTDFNDYDHVVHDSDENLSEDERNINQQEEFEHKYNFRFEEPDQEFIKKYPRTLENSLRKKDTRRSQKRAEVKTRKEQEKFKKQEEIKQLKILKRKEIEEKLEKLKEITGNDDLKLNIMDLDGDFDPDEYDKKMNEIFNEEYYTNEQDDMKPEFPEIDKELCIESTWDDYDPTADEIIQEDIPYHEVPHCEDPDFNMDADYVDQKSLEAELIQSSKTKKKRRRSKFAEMISKEKPKYDPIQYSSYKEYYDQYYALDYEDIIGDLPCRFKYRQVVPNDYGLSVEEILMADDKELNKWCSLKKALEYKPEYKELNDVKTYKHKANNEALKRKILKSLYSTTEEEEEKEEEKISSECQNLSDTKIKNKRKRKAKLNKQTKLDENKHNETNTKIENSSNEHHNIEKLSENSLQINKSINHSNKRKLEESLEEGDESKLVSKQKKKNKVKHNIVDKKDSAEHIQDATEQKPSEVNKSQDSTEKLKTVENNNNLKDKKSKIKNKKENVKTEKDTLSKKEKRKQLFNKSKKNKTKMNGGDNIAALSEERLKAYGLNPKKFRNKLKYKKKN